MGWIKWTGKALEFTGKLAQTDGFEQWARSQRDKVIQSVGLETGGYILGWGRDRKAKGLVWNQLKSLAATSPELKAAIEDFVIHYPHILDNLASRFDRLPHVNSDLCVLPRFLVNRDALAEVKRRLGNSEELATLKGGASLRDYFFDDLVDQLDQAYTKAAGKASPDRPLELDKSWVVGFNPHYEWGRGAGHYFVYTDVLRAAKDAKKECKKQGRKDAAELLTKCLKWLGELSAGERAQLEAKLP